MTLSVQLHHRQGAFTLDATFQASPGITALFGRSGAGKTTILRAVAGLLRPDAGRITLDDTVLLDRAQHQALPAHRRRLGVIFQEARLFPHLSVRQNLGYGRWLSPDRMPGHERDRIIEMLGLGPLLDRRPSGLSGGETQRVAIGRALLSKPRLLLADEPLAALDDARKAEILPYFEMMRDELAVPILYVSHATPEVARLATTVVALRDGAVLRQGTAAEVLSDPRVAPRRDTALGADIIATVAAHTDDGLTELRAGDVPILIPRTDRAIGAQVRIHIAAHDVILARDQPHGLSALNVLPCRVETLRFGDGPQTNVSLSCGAIRLEARVVRRSIDALALAPGARCFAVIKTVAIGADTTS